MLTIEEDTLISLKFKKIECGELLYVSELEEVEPFETQTKSSTSFSLQGSPLIQSAPLYTSFDQTLFDRLCEEVGLMKHMFGDLGKLVGKIEGLCGSMKGCLDKLMKENMLLISKLIDELRCRGVLTFALGASSPIKNQAEEEKEEAKEAETDEEDE